jgi:predicted dehydrogenase
MVKLAIIGCGYWGPNLIRNFSEIKESELLICCDLDKTKLDKLKEDHPSLNTTQNFEDVLNDKEIEALVIATPSYTHHKLAKAALLANKHVLIEKPLTDTSEDTRDLIKTADEKGKILMVDHTFEYSGAINKIKEILDSGELGDIYYLRAEWLNLGLLQPHIDVVWDLATHIISIINYVTNLKAQAVSVNAKGYLRQNIPEIANVNIEFPNNVSAYLTVGWLEPEKTRKLTIVGSKKMLVYNLTDEKEPIKIYNKSANLISEEKFQVDYTDEGYSAPTFDNPEPLNTMARHFLDCINNNKKPKSDGENGLNVIKLLESINESLKTKGAKINIE